MRRARRPGERARPPGPRGAACWPRAVPCDCPDHRRERGARRSGTSVPTHLGGRRRATAITLDSAVRRHHNRTACSIPRPPCSDPFAGDITITARHVVRPGDLDVRGGRRRIGADPQSSIEQPFPIDGGNIILTGKVDGPLGTGRTDPGGVQLNADGNVSCAGRHHRPRRRATAIRAASGGYARHLDAWMARPPSAASCSTNASRARGLRRRRRGRDRRGRHLTLTRHRSTYRSPGRHGRHSPLHRRPRPHPNRHHPCSSQGVRGDGGSVEFDAGRALTAGQHHLHGRR